MASNGALFSVCIIICITAGKTGFVDVKCKTSNVGQYGQHSLLECVVETSKEAKGAQIRVVSWKKEGDEKFLFLFQEGKTTRQPRYEFAEPSWNDKNMNVSLLITNTLLSDSGAYFCHVMTDRGYDDGDLYLEVTAKYSVPTISFSRDKNTENIAGTLTCKSDGGYPKGQLRWFSTPDTEWTQSSTMEARQTDGGLFQLSSELTLLHGSSFDQYACVVFNASGGRVNEATYDFTKLDKMFEAEKHGSKDVSKIVAPVVVIGSLIVGLLLAMLFFRRRSRQRRRHSTAPLMGDHEEVSTCELDAEKGETEITQNG
uniref:V-set domain-containing T-cell activation inhibitor 1 isoform X1 n=1 Tax=Monopterus albus TaxID=43700 RepID=UPI0009B3621B|nr:V-set domain-containing T-cell activation inhibitor 1-like isoform X1 [Monopterus albus]